MGKRFQLILNPETEQHKLLIEKQQANRKKTNKQTKNLLKSVFFSFTCRAGNDFPEVAVRKVPEETFLLLASI